MENTPKKSPNPQDPITMESYNWNESSPAVHGNMESSIIQEEKSFSPTDESKLKSHEVEAMKKSDAHLEKLHDVEDEEKRKRDKDEFQIKFSLPASETLIEDFSCAYNPAGGLYQGRMWISKNYICFHSPFLSKLVKINIRKVLEVQKRSTLGVFPSALDVCLHDGRKISFMSFIYREQAHQLLSDLVVASRLPVNNNNPGGNPKLEESPDDKDIEHPVADYRKSLQPTVKIVDIMSSPVKLGETAVDIPSLSAPAIIASTSPPLLSTSTSSSTSLSPPESQPLPVVVASSTPPASVVQSVVRKELPSLPLDSVLPSGGSCKHSNVPSNPPAVKETLNVSLDNFYQLFLTNGSDVWNQAIAPQLQGVDVEIADWPGKGTCCKERKIKFRVPVAAVMGFSAGSTKVIQTQNVRLVSAPMRMIVMDTTSQSPDVPYGESFVTHTYWEITPSADSKSVTVNISLEVKWLKSVWGIKGMIEKNAAEGTTSYLVSWIAAAKKMISEKRDSPVTAVETVPQESKKTTTTTATTTTTKTVVTTSKPVDTISPPIASIVQPQVFVTEQKSVVSASNNNTPVNVPNLEQPLKPVVVQGAPVTSQEKVAKPDGLIVGLGVFVLIFISWLLWAFYNLRNRLFRTETTVRTLQALVLSLNAQVGGHQAPAQALADMHSSEAFKEALSEWKGKVAVLTQMLDTFVDSRDTLAKDLYAKLSSAETFNTEPDASWGGLLGVTLLVIGLSVALDFYFNQYLWRLVKRQPVK